MLYSLSKNCIQINGKNDFSAKEILECGQTFAYEKKEDRYVVYSLDKRAEIFEQESGYIIETKDVDYFKDFFDLDTDYGAIKRKLQKFDILKKPIAFGSGIRILKQDIFETLISFIISANNNIKRIQLILNRLREKLGEKKDGYFAFPTQEKLLSVDEKFFKDIAPI